jgi:glycosyltransferase involved in cell wall biosynthesis
MKTLGIIGNNLRNLERTGQLGRFTEYYWKYYAKEFDRIYVFSERCESRVPSYGGKCIVVEPRSKVPDIVYQLFLPFVHKEFRQCDLIRVMHMTGSLPAVIGRILWRIPFVATYGYDYGSFVWMGRRSKALLFLKYLYIKSVVALGMRLADEVIATAPEAFQDISRRGGKEKISYIPNGVDTSEFTGADGKREASKVMRCVFVGRFERQKNLFLLIDTLALLKDVSVSAALIGDGSLREALHEYATKKGVDVAFEGVRIHNELPALLRRYQVFVLPSVEEGHPKALLEAMSCGLACVGSNVRGINTLVRDGKTGLLCELTPEAFAAALRRLYGETELRQRLGREARTFIQENFDLKSLLEKEASHLGAIVEKSV